MYWQNLQKAAEIAQERQKQYGDIEENFKNIAETCEKMFGKKFSVIDICDIMIATKFARNRFCEKDDNLTDAINYIAIKQELLNKSK